MKILISATATVISSAFIILFCIAPAKLDIQYKFTITIKTASPKEVSLSILSLNNEDIIRTSVEKKSSAITE